MAEQEAGTEAYAIKYSESGKASRRELPPEALSALFDIQDALADNPDAFPGRTRAISRDGTVRLYSRCTRILKALGNPRFGIKCAEKLGGLAGRGEVAISRATNSPERSGAHVPW